MCADCTFLKLTFILPFLIGVLSSWHVDYHQQHVCAVNGSSVVIPCSFSYPDKDTVQSVKWGRTMSQIYSGVFIYDSESNHTTSRHQYVGDKKHNCSFKILNVEPNDAGQYTFRFITNGDKWTGKDGPTLRIVDLNISLTNSNGNEVVKEGDAVRLTCTNSCNDAKFTSELTWFRNGQFIKEGPELYAQNMAYTDSGNYSCSLKSHPGATSKVMQVHVEYSPKNTSVSVKPSTEEDAGSNVTLICSSDANPAASYTWFRKHSSNIVPVGHRHEHHVKGFFQSTDQYFCTATNKYGSQNSSVVTLMTEVLWANYNRNVLIVTTCIGALLIVTAVVLITRIWKKRTTSAETDCEEETQVEVSFHTRTQSTSTGLIINDRKRGLSVSPSSFMQPLTSAPRGRQTAQQMDSHDDDGCGIYSTVCRTRPLNPSYIEP